MIWRPEFRAEMEARSAADKRRPPPLLDTGPDGPFGAGRRGREWGRGLTLQGWIDRQHDMSLMAAVVQGVDVGALLKSGDWRPHANSAWLIRTPASLERWWKREWPYY